MSKEHNELDKLTSELLKKSIQKPNNSDFNDQLMEKIVLAPSPIKISENGINAKKAWFLWGISIGLFLLSLIIAGNLFSGYFNDLDALFRIIINYVFYGGLFLFIPLVLYQLDSLLQLISWRSKISNSGI